MIKIDIKPLSVNEAWQGKRYRSTKYKIYKHSVKCLLPKLKIPPPPYEVHYTFGFSSTLSDWDNPVKPTQDIIASHYGFNDKLIIKATVTITHVPKGQEFFTFQINTFPHSQL